MNPSSVDHARHPVLEVKGLVDYSLLIGVQPKHHDRQGPQNLAELVSSIKR